jgi:hypothetical protein
MKRRFEFELGFNLCIICEGKEVAGCKETWANLKNFKFYLAYLLDGQLIKIKNNFSEEVYLELANLLKEECLAQIGRGE